jgi:hypothetical protein
MYIDEPFTATGDSKTFKLQAGRRYAYSVAGNFAGNTVRLYYLIGDTWVEYEDSDLNQSGGMEVTVANYDHKISVAGGSAPAIHVVLRPVIM